VVTPHAVEFVENILFGAAKKENSSFKILSHCPG